MIVGMAGIAAAQQGSGRTAPNCPSDVVVEARSDGNLLTWFGGGTIHTQSNVDEGSGSLDAPKIHIYRAFGEVSSPVESPANDPGWTLIANLDGGPNAFLDQNVTHGATYSYVLTFDDGIESANCDVATITAIPFFGSAIMTWLAAGGAVVAFAAIARRKRA